MARLLDRYFQLTAHRTSIRIEIVAGVTTFLTMAHIIFVQPAVLSAAGMDAGAVMVATCVASAIGTLLMALLANYPIGVAPAMGHNFFGGGYLVDGRTLSPIVAPALVLVGVMMMQSVRDIRWDDPTEAIPSFLTLIVMPLAVSITDGIAFGFIAFVVLKAATGRAREAHALTWVFAGVFLARYGLGLR